MATKKRTIIGVFEDRYQADKAVNALLEAGFRQKDIGVAMRNTDGTIAGGTEVEDGSHAESGAMTGALTGLGLGALAGLGVLAGLIPAVGPAIAAGTLGVVLSNAAAGAGIAGLAGALIGAGVPEHEAKYYHEEFEAGRTIVTVAANGRSDEASAILREYGAYDMSSREAEMESIDSVGEKVSTTEPVASTSKARTSRRGEDTIEVKEERLRAEKRPVEAGEVRVRKEVHTETKTLEVPVEREEVIIERTPVAGRVAAEGLVTDDLREGEQIRIPVRQEQVKVTKEAVVTEEVKVGKRVVHDTEKVSGKVRKEEVKVEQTGNVDVKTSGKTKKNI